MSGNFLGDADHHKLFVDDLLFLGNASVEKWQTLPCEPDTIVNIAFIFDVEVVPMDMGFKYLVSILNQTNMA